MEQLILDFLTSLAKQGPLFVALAIAIHHLKKSDDKKAAVNETLIAALNQERAERIDVLEAHVVECDRRHEATQIKYERLLLRVAKLDQHDKSTSQGG